MNPTTGTATHQSLLEFAEQWAAAERRADTGFLSSALTPDFIGIGPLGFMLTKDEWLQRHTSGDLKYDALNLDDVTTRVYGDAAIIVGRQTQRASYKGQPVPVPGDFRASLVLVKQQGRWLLAGIQLSPIGSPPGQPQSQGR